MKAAILATFSNLEIAHRLMLQLKGQLEVTLYYKRGDEYLKQNKYGNTFIYNYRKIEMFKDIRKEKFNQIILVELPGARIKILPYFLLLALFSQAEDKSVYLRDGTYVALTPAFLIGPALQLAGVYLRSLAVLPIVITNLLFLILLCTTVDFLISVRSRVKP